MNHLFNMGAQPQLIIQEVSSIDELIARFREIIKEETPQTGYLIPDLNETHGSRKHIGIKEYRPR